MRGPSRQAGGRWFEPSTAYRMKALLARGFRFLDRQRLVGGVARKSQRGRGSRLETCDKTHYDCWFGASDLYKKEER
jgi:hypothetical protein